MEGRKGRVQRDPFASSFVMLGKLLELSEPQFPHGLWGCSLRPLQHRALAGMEIVSLVHHHDF